MISTYAITFTSNIYMDFFSYIVFFCTLQDLSTCNHVCVCFGYMYEKEVKINRKQYINSNGDSFPYIKKNKKITGILDHSWCVFWCIFLQKNLKPNHN